MTPLAIIMLSSAILFEPWIFFALVFAFFTKDNRRPYSVRVGDALKFQHLR